jgi:hypothetical protein
MPNPSSHPTDVVHPPMSRPSPFDPFPLPRSSPPPRPNSPLPFRNKRYSIGLGRPTHPRHPEVTPVRISRLPMLPRVSLILSRLIRVSWRFPRRLLSSLSHTARILADDWFAESWLSQAILHYPEPQASPIKAPSFQASHGRMSRIGRADEADGSREERGNGGGLSERCLLLLYEVVSPVSSIS